MIKLPLSRLNRPIANVSYLCKLLTIVGIFKDRAQHRALRDSRCDWDRVRFLALNNDLLPTVTKEGLYPAQGSASDTVGVQFHDQL